MLYLCAIIHRLQQFLLIIIMKIKVSQDTLYHYLLAHDVKMLRLSEMIGTDGDTVTSCFRRRKDRNGVPRRFSAENIRRLNEALPLLANELRQRVLVFGSGQTFTNKNGRMYDPGLIEPMRVLGRYLNITGIVTRVCGWSKAKKASVFGRRTTTLYGNISESDVIAINTEVLSVAAVLDSYELVADDDSSIRG